MDHHVPAAITSGLRRRGIDCLTAAEDGAERRQDPDLLARATELQRVLFTMDDDLLAIAAECIRSGRTFAGVVYAHQLEITIGQAVRDLELLVSVYGPADMENRVERLPV
jgi:hypothetical protein